MVDYKTLSKQRNGLGKNPKCPDCGGKLSDSILVPYYMICGNCDTIMPPTLKNRIKIKKAFGDAKKSLEKKGLIPTKIINGDPQ